MSDSVGAARSGLRRRRKLLKKSEAFLPDDVVMNILSWLPAKDVLRYRCVCQVWRDLTSTRDFTDLHFRHSFPMILKEDRDGWILLDRCWEPAQTRSKIHKLYGPDDEDLVFSHNGLIVIADICFSESVFIIYNPIYRDVVNIKVNTQRSYKYKGRVCGVFFHPVQKEYCILWQKTLSCRPCRVQYRILSLESDPKWRDIGIQNVSIYPYTEPMLIDKYIYSIVDPLASQRSDDHCEMMEYDIINEEFRVIPCPVRFNYVNVNLVNIDGAVSVVQVLPSKEYMEINIWTLNDGVKQLWTSCNYVVSNDVGSGYRVPKAIAFRNGELVLQSNGSLDGRLYVCNLKLRTFRKFGQKYKSRVKFFPHVTSLVSLKNCKSNICMVDEDEDEDENNQP